MTLVTASTVVTSMVLASTVMASMAVTSPMVVASMVTTEVAKQMQAGWVSLIPERLGSSRLGLSSTDWRSPFCLMGSGQAKMERVSVSFTVAV